MKNCRKHLHGEILDICELSDSLIDNLFALYFRYFENVKKEIFIDHISHKDKIIILYERGCNNIRGFSTLKTMRATVDQKTFSAIFSGDTIIDHRFWGDLELVKNFAYYAGQIKRTIPEEEKLYWFLISKGYKTYRFLPVFTKKYYPNYREEFPLTLKKRLDTLAKALYPEEYNDRNHLLTFKNKIGNLRPGVGDITQIRLSDPDISFFAKINPHHMEGVELTCITELSLQNFKGDDDKHSVINIPKTYFSKGLKGESLL